METPICVTGATGFLASWVVKLLLDEGCTVHATVRSESKVAFLRALNGANERLKVFSGCDLLNPGSFDEAIQGCSTVIHTASPFFMQSDEAGLERLVKPAVQGTENVLSSCVKAKVQKVVLTSSTAAIYVCYGSKDAEHVFSEKDWSPEEKLIENNNFYSLSKLRAEQKAWEIAGKEDCPFKLSVQNPCLILGGQLPSQTHFNTSCAAVIKLFHQDLISQSCMHLVDVRDVAKAHVNATKMPLDWKGWGQRNLLVGASVMQETVIKCLNESKEIPENWKHKLPTKLDEKIPPAALGAPPPNITKFDLSRSISKQQDGGLELGGYIGLGEMLESTFKSCIANGFDSIEKYDIKNL